jgi:hypothetical protein
MISFAVSASSGLAIFRVTFTKNSCSTCTLRHPSRDSQSCSTSARACFCLAPAEASCAYSRTLVSTNRRLALMNAVSAPANVPAGAETHPLAQPGKAAVTGTGVSSLLLD